MSQTKRFDLIILGAGIAGLSVAAAARKRGLKTLVIDKSKPGSGASGAPLGLLNPATGRRGKKVWQAETAMQATLELFEEVQSATGADFFWQNGVIRPALDRKIARQMRESFETDNWLEGWLEWLDEETIKKEFPGLNCTDGGIWIPKACTVSLAGYTKALSHYLEQNGVELLAGCDYSIADAPGVAGESHPPKKPWQIRTQTNNYEAEHLVAATGASLADAPEWSFLKLHPVKGQLLTATLRKPLPFQCSVSSLGYIASNPHQPGEITLGSTYEHTFHDNHPDEEGARYLLDRHEATLPGLTSTIQTRRGWAGVRVTTPDKRPAVGPHPDIPNLYVLGGLGSKGLMHGALLGEMLVGEMLVGGIVEGMVISVEVWVGRFG